MRIALLHYAGPPTIGGVESTIAHHARGLVALGHQVRIISGKGDSFAEGIEHHINPLFGSTDAEVQRVKKQLDSGDAGLDFAKLVEQIEAALRTALDGCEVCIAHNILSLNKNLPLTAALARLNDSQSIRIIAWNHDLAWTNEQYLPELYPGYPWDLLRTVWPRVRYVTVSLPRQQELAALLQVPPEQVKIITAGVDLARFLKWTPTTTMLAERLGLPDADLLLLLPARLTRRKNIGFALRILAVLRAQTGCDARLIVTGPPGPHNPTNMGYLGELLTLRHELELDSAAHFLYDQGTAEMPLVPDDDTLSNLYGLSDALFFPSVQEGFGIPILEAGLAGLPIICADIPPFRAIAQNSALYFNPITDAPETVAARLWGWLKALPTVTLRTTIRHQYRWDSLIRDELVPLLEDTHQ